MAWTPEQRRKYHRTYQERWRQRPEGKKSNRERQRRRRHKVKQAVVEAMGGRCWRCGWNEHLSGLEFDHRVPEQKQHVPSSLISRIGSTAAIEYITKNCIMLCANCHVLKTVAYGDNLRGNNISDTSKERQLFESLPITDPRPASSAAAGSLPDAAVRM